MDKVTAANIWAFLWSSGVNSSAAFYALEKSDTTMAEAKTGFWHTLPGLIAAIAALITAIAGLFAALAAFYNNKDDRGKRSEPYVDTRDVDPEIERRSRLRRKPAPVPAENRMD